MNIISANIWASGTFSTKLVCKSHRDFLLFFLFFNFSKWANLGLFSIYFQSFQSKQQINVKNSHPIYSAGIRTHNPVITSLLPWPLDQGSRATIIMWRHQFDVYFKGRSINGRFQPWQIGRRFTLCNRENWQRTSFCA